MLRGLKFHNFAGCRVVAEFAPMAGLAGMAIGVITWCAQQLM